MVYRSNDLTNMRPDGSYIQTEHLIDYPEPERQGRMISVLLSEAEAEVLDAIFVQLAWGPEQEVITEGDWDTIVGR